MDSTHKTTNNYFFIKSTWTESLTPCMFMLISFLKTTFVAFQIKPKVLGHRALWFRWKMNFLTMKIFEYSGGLNINHWNIEHIGIPNVLKSGFPKKCKQWTAHINKIEEISIINKSRSKLLILKRSGSKCTICVPFQSSIPLN